MTYRESLLSQSQSVRCVGMPEKTTDSILEDFQKLGALHKACLRYVGLWVLDSSSSIFSRCLYHVYNKLILTTMFVFATTLFADICINFGDLLVVSDDGCIFAGLFIVLYKTMVFQFRHKRIARLKHNTMEACYRLCEVPNSGEDKILDKYLLICRVTFYGFSVLAFVLMIALLFFVPMEDGELPIRAYYPFDTTNYPWHSVGYFVEACSIVVGLTAIMGTESVAVNICNLFLAQLEILNVHFRNCSGRQNALADIDKRVYLDVGERTCYEISSTASYRKDNYHPDEIRDSFAKRFERSVRSHQRLLALIDDFNEIFSVGTFIQMLSSTMMICLTAYQAALGTGQKSTMYKFLVYLITAVSQLLYICWMGNEVMYQSASLMQSQWFSGWSDEFTVKTGRRLILSMIFSKKTLNLKAGMFFVLSMETFIVILRGAYSFFALLNTVHSEVDQ